MTYVCLPMIHLVGQFTRSSPFTSEILSWKKKAKENVFICVKWITFESKAS